MSNTDTTQNGDGQILATLSQGQLIRRGFVKHRLAHMSLYILIVLYWMAAFAEFLAPYPSQWRNLDYLYAPPQMVRFNFSHGLHINAVRANVDPITFQKTYIEHPKDKSPLRFFVKGEPYNMWGLIPMNRHFLGVDKEKYKAWKRSGKSQSDPDDAQTTSKDLEPMFYMLGADKYGHDIFSRIIYGSRISLSVGLISIAFTFILGMAIGGVSGYVGGRTDNLIQRAIEIINAFPQLPLWLALAAAMPQDWSALKNYFAITVVLSLLNWTGLARVVRGKILSLREEDYAMAARLLGASHTRTLSRHLLPGFTSHIIVSLTLAIPGMILGETGLSFLGLGLRPPVVSWGVMLQECRDIKAVTIYPWMVLPVFFIVLTVLCFNFVGDGLRDAADPYSST